MTSWKEYRANYATLPLDVHRDMYDGLAVQNSNQRRFTGATAQKFFEGVSARRVVELGGWDGEMADKILTENDDIESWTNYELAKIQPITDDPRFEMIVSDDEWAWDHEGFTGDTFVSSHSIEHVNVSQVEKILQRMDDEGFTGAYIQAPIPVNEPGDWEKWPNSGHIIECSMNDLDLMFEDHGWQLFMRNSLAHDQVRGWRR